MKFGLLATLLSLISLGAHAAPGTKVEDQDVAADRYMDAKEAELNDLDLTADNIRFTSFHGYAGTSMLLIVERKSKAKGGKNGWNRIAVLKTRSGSTNPRGEVGTYKLARYLDTPLVPVTVLRTLSKPAIEKIIATLDTLDFTGTRKELARLSVLEDLKVQLEEETPTYIVALKEFVRGFKILPSRGFKGLPAELNLLKHLDPKGPMPSDDKVTLVARDKKPRYHAETTYAQVARDVSSLVLIDALSSQYDRWNGRNVHFRLEDERKFKRDKNDRKLFTGGAARVMSLDNGASFVRGQRRSFDVLDRYVGRFDKDVVERLYKLYRWVYADQLRSRRWMGLDKRGFWRFRVSLARVIAAIDAKTALYGDAARFQKVEAPPKTEGAAVDGGQK